MSLTVYCPPSLTACPVDREALAAHSVMQAQNNNSARADSTLQFFQDLSNRLLTGADTRPYDELVALGYWLRKGNLSRYMQSLSDTLYKPLGLVVHYAPNNVDTQFVYSWACALLMGNRNIVRLGSQYSALQDVLIKAINELLSRHEYTRLAGQNIFCHFERDNIISGRISEAADARVIWGGDSSVGAIRALPTKPRCRDISFADRYSCSLIHGDHVSDHDIDNVASALQRDIQAFTQQACSSPRVLFWLGNQAFQQPLLTRLGELDNAPAVNQRNEQLVYSQYLMATSTITSAQQYGGLSVITLSSQSESLAPLLELHPGYQSLLLVNLACLSELTPWLDGKCQTLSYWGVDKAAVIKFLASPSITGVDRAVPVGQALNFTPEWDGYELLSQLSRRVMVL